MANLRQCTILGLSVLLLAGLSPVRADSQPKQYRVYLPVVEKPHAIYWTQEGN
jgi:hypothetical protein